MGEPGFVFKVNPLFLLVLVIFIIGGQGVELFIAFVLVFLHEIVHLIVARRYGYQVHKIELFPFGGMAEYRGLLEMEPFQEAIVAATGPVFNLSLALFFYYYGSKIEFISTYYLNLLLKYNLFIGLFNFLPALPLDGGRILRSIFVTKMGFCRGTLLAIKIARLFAICGAIVGILALVFQQTNIWVLFISFFVYGAAVKEKKKILYHLVSYLTKRKEYIENVDIKPVYLQVIKSDIYLQDLLTYFVPGKFNLFYIPGKDKFISEIELLDAFFGLKNREMTVGELV